MIQRVNLDPSSTKELYCVECILEHEMPKSPSIQSLNDFLTSAFAFYATHNNYRSATTFPTETFEVLSRQQDNLNRLIEHIDKEKKEVAKVFNKISEKVIEILNKKKEEYLSLLDQQISLFKNHFAFFTEQLNQGFPRSEEGELIPLSQQNLENKFNKIANYSQLKYFVRKIRDDFHQTSSVSDIVSYEYESKKDYFSKLVKIVEKTASQSPTFDLANFDISTLVNKLKHELENSLAKRFSLKDAIISHALSPYYLEGNLLGPESFGVIKSWIPKKYSTTFKLLYKSSLHGFTPEAFHAQCDHQGPTVTIIECQFIGSPVKNVIGGFLDKDWHDQEKCIFSKDAFVFSLTSGIKCPILETHYAAYGGNYLPIFGEGFDICISDNLERSFMFPKSYKNAECLVDSHVYKGSDTIYYFVPCNIEVYALNRL